jgi:Putative zinc-finger
MTRRVPHELTCSEMVRLVTEFLEDALSLEERTRFEQHLVFCKGCAEYLRQMRKTIEACSALREEERALPATGGARRAEHTEEGLSEKAREELLRVFRGICK